MRRPYQIILSAFVLIMLAQSCAEIPKKEEAPPSPSGEVFSPESQSRLAREYEQQGAIREALEQWRAVMAIDPSSREAAAAVGRLEKERKEKADEAFRRGLDAWRKGLADEARRCFLQTLYLDPNRKEALQKLQAVPPPPEGVLVHKVAPGETLSTIAQKYYGTTKGFQKIVQYNKLSDPSKLTAGQQIFIPGAPPEAQKAAAPVEVAVKKGETPPAPSTETQAASGGQPQATPTTEPPKIYIAETREQKTEPERSTEFLEASQRATYQSEELYYQQGVGFYGEKDYESAAVEFQKVVNANPAYKNALNYYKDSRYRFGRELIAKGNLDKAYVVFKELVALDPSYQDSERYLRVTGERLKEQHYMRGIQFYNQEHLEEALKEWQVVAQIDPHYKKVSYYIERCEQILKKVKELKSSGS